MSQILDSGIGSLWYTKQSAKGTKATAGTTVTDALPKWFDGLLAVKAADGMEEFIDGQRFGSPSMWRDTVLGDLGTVTIQAQPYTTSLYFAQLLGKDTTTGAGDPWTHTITSAGSAAAYGTWWQKTGSVVGPVREAFFDTKPGKAVWTASDKQNPAHLALSILGLQSEVFTADPTQTQDAEDPYYWTETSVSGTSQVVVDAMTLGEVEEEVIEVDTGMEPWRGNDIRPNQLVEKKGTIVRAIKSIVTDETLKKFYKALYNTEAPTAGTTAAAKVFYAAIKNKYEKSATRKVTFESPRVQVDPKDMAVGAQREGGPVPISFGGQCLKGVSAEPALTITALNGAATSQA